MFKKWQRSKPNNPHTRCFTPSTSSTKRPEIWDWSLEMCLEWQIATTKEKSIKNNSWEPSWNLKPIWKKAWSTKCSTPSIQTSTITCLKISTISSCGLTEGAITKMPAGFKKNQHKNLQLCSKRKISKSQISSIEWSIPCLHQNLAVN